MKVWLFWFFTVCFVGLAVTLLDVGWVAYIAGLYMGLIPVGAWWVASDR